MSQGNSKQKHLEDLSKEEMDAIRASNKKTMLNLFDKLNSKLEVKAKELVEFFNSQVEEFNKHIKAIDDKYQKMYGALVREFLVKMEGRIYGTELHSSATLELLLKKLYYLEKFVHVNTQKDQPFAEFDDWLPEQVATHNGLVDSLKSKMQAAMEEESKVNGEPEQTADAGGDQSSDESGGDESGAADKSDSGSVE